MMSLILSLSALTKIACIFIPSHQYPLLQIVALIDVLSNVLQQNSEHTLEYSSIRQYLKVWVLVRGGVDWQSELGAQAWCDNIEGPVVSRQHPVAQVSPIVLAEHAFGAEVYLQLYISINIQIEFDLHLKSNNQSVLSETSSQSIKCSECQQTYILLEKIVLLVNSHNMSSLDFQIYQLDDDLLPFGITIGIVTIKYNSVNMKTELFNALTKFNDDAQLDEQRITAIKKSLYEKEISVSNRIRSNTSTDFNLKPINVTFLNSSFLNDNPNFKQIKLAFYNYNLEVANLQSGQIDDRHLRPCLMDSLLKFMRLVMLTDDRPAQARMLAVINAWFKEILTKREYKTKLQREFDRQLEQRLAQVRLAAKPPVSYLPSEVMKAERASYLKKFRTLHEDIHAPDERLKDFKRRILNFEQTEAKPSSVPPASRVKYQRPPPLIFHKDVPQQPSEFVSQQPKQNITSITTNANVSTDADAQTSQQVLPTQQPKPQEQQEQLMLGEQPAEDDQQQPQPQLPDQQGKLDPNTKNYIYPASAYNAKAEMRMNDRIQKLQSDADRRNREDQAKYESMKEWSRQRTRLQAEISRKIESVREFAKVHQKIQKAKTQPNQRFINLVKEEPVLESRFEDSINQQRLGEVKRHGQKYINYQKRDLINHSRGLSMFDRKRAKTQSKSLSQILNEHSREKQRDASFSEIEQIKNRFAKYKIPVELKRVSDGLLHPNDIQPERLEAIGPKDVSLPSNPFMKVAKKKRKGKKK